MIVVTAKVGPDVDGLACAVGYAELLAAGGTAAVAVIAGRPDAEARFVQQLVGAVVETDPPELFSGIVLVDASGQGGLPAFVDPGLVVEVIDHRLPHDAARLFPNASIQIEAVGAAATLVFERFERVHVTPTRATALILQAAIESNTQRLRGSVTTQRDIDAMVRLREVASLPPGAVDDQFRARLDEIVLDLASALVREAKSFDDPDGSFVISQLEGPGILEHAHECSRRAAVLGGRTILNLVDPVLPRSVVIVPDADVRAWVAHRAGLVFEGESSAQPDVLLRKQLVARIRSTR